MIVQDEQIQERLINSIRTDKSGTEIEQEIKAKSMLQMNENVDIRTEGKRSNKVTEVKDVGDQ